MIYKYRKKPVIIEAIQYFEYINLRECIEFATSEGRTALWDHEGFKIHTLEGIHLAINGDYIIKGIQGECYPCKPDIFDLTYEKETK